MHFIDFFINQNSRFLNSFFIRQDEGWQMGIMQNDGRKGVFPENFTRRF